MDDIAAAAGTRKTVFYRHFTDRAGLYAAVSERVDALILRDVAAALDADSTRRTRPAWADRPRRLIAEAIDAYLRLVENDPEVYRFIVSAPLLDRPSGGDPAGGVTDHIADQISAVIGQALESAGRSSDPAAVWGPGVVGMVRAAADQWLASAEPMTARGPRGTPDRPGLGRAVCRVDRPRRHARRRDEHAEHRAAHRHRRPLGPRPRGGPLRARTGERSRLPPRS